MANRVYRKRIKKLLAAIMSVSLVMSSVSITTFATELEGTKENPKVTVTVTETTDGAGNTINVTVTEKEWNEEEIFVPESQSSTEGEETELPAESEGAEQESESAVQESGGEEQESEGELQNTQNVVTVTDGNEKREDSVVKDDQGRVIEESGKANGSETTTVTDTSVEHRTEDRDNLENDDTIEGEPETILDRNGEWSEPVETQKENIESTEIDPGYAGDITVNLTPGTSGSGSAGVDENQVYQDQLAGDRPEGSSTPGIPVEEDVLDKETGDKIGTKTTTTDVNTKVEDIKNKDNQVVGYTTTEVTTTTIVTELSNTVEVPSNPATVTSPTTTYDPVTTTEVVLPEKPTGGETTDAAGNKVVTSVVEIKAEVDGVETVVGYQTTTETFDANGNKISWGSESIWGKKTTTVTTKETISTTTTTTDYITTETTTTDFTEGTTVNGIWVTSTPREVTASMGQVTVGEGNGENQLRALNIDKATLLNNLSTNDLFNPNDWVEYKKIDGDVFQYLGHLVGSDYLIYRKSGTNASDTDVYIYVLKDANGNEFYGYCADVATHAEKGYLYEIANIEDADYYQNNADGQAEAHIRAIALNGFWGTASGTGSLAAVKKLLMDAGYADWNTLTEGQALAATQAAMWKYGNNGNAYPTNEENVSRYLLGKVDNENQQSDKNIQKLYEVLVGLTVPVDTSTNILDTKDILAASLTVGEKVAGNTNNNDTNDANDVFDTDISFTVALIPDANDTLVAVITQNGREVGRKSLTAANGTADQSGNTTYRIDGIPLQEGIDINLSLEGTQNLRQGVYIYTAKLGVDASQTFVGVAEGTHKVDLDVNMTFNVTDETATKHESQKASERTKQDYNETATVDTVIDEEVVATLEVTSVTVAETSSEWNNGYLRTYTYKNEPNNTNDENNNNTPNDPRGNEYDPVVISDEGTPLAGDPIVDVITDGPAVLGAYDILDDPVPLGNMNLQVLPMTGDVSVIWMLLSALSGLALAGMSLVDKKRKK